MFKKRWRQETPKLTATPRWPRQFSKIIAGERLASCQPKVPSKYAEEFLDSIFIFQLTHLPKKELPVEVYFLKWFNRSTHSARSILKNRCWVFISAQNEAGLDIWSCVFRVNQPITWLLIPLIMLHVTVMLSHVISSESYIMSLFLKSFQVILVIPTRGVPNSCAFINNLLSVYQFMMCPHQWSSPVFFLVGNQIHRIIDELTY